MRETRKRPARFSPFCSNEFPAENDPYYIGSNRRRLRLNVILVFRPTDKAASIRAEMEPSLLKPMVPTDDVSLPGLNVLENRLE